eukprot:gene7507-10012_t
MKRQRTATTESAASSVAAAASAAVARALGGDGGRGGDASRTVVRSPAVVIPLITLEKSKLKADDQGSADEVGATGQACFYHGWKDSHQFSQESFVIDDGTATAVILRPRLVAVPTLHGDEGEGGGGGGGGADAGGMAAGLGHPKVGDLVECYGNVTADRAVAAAAFAVQTDPMYEPMRWLEQLDLHKRLYSLPPAAVQCTDQASAAPSPRLAARGGSEAEDDMMTSSQQEDAEIEAAMMDALIPSQVSSTSGSQQVQHDQQQQQQQQQQGQQGQQGQQPVPESPRSIPMSQDGIMASQPTSKHADELDGFIRAAGADGVELTDLYGL